MSLNLSSTNHLLELVTTGTGAVHVTASFIDDNAGTKTGGSQTTIISSATTTTIVSAPGASIVRSVHHINIQAVAGNTITVQKDVAATDHVLIGPVALLAAERLEFTASVGWKRTDTTGSGSIAFPAIADDTFLANTSGSANAPSAKTFTSLAGTGLSYNATTHALDNTGTVVTPDDLEIFGTPTNTGVPFVIYVAFSAGAGGSADDVEVYNATVPFDLRILESWLVTATAVTSATVQAFDAAGGAGNALTTAMSATVAGKTSDNSSATALLELGSSWYLRRSDSGVGGEFFSLCVRTDIEEEEIELTPFYEATRTLSGDWHMGHGPVAMYVSGLDKTFVVWYVVGTAGHKSVQIASYNHATSTWSERYVVGNFDLEDDDHGAPALCQDADGFFHVFYGSHASALSYSISTAANDISAWTQQTSLSAPQTYPHPNFVGSVIYLMSRNESIVGESVWSLRTATPSAGSATFSGFTTLVTFGADSRCNTGDCIVVGTDIHFVATRANAADTARKGVYYFRYDTTNGSIKNHDASVTVLSGSLPVDLTTANTSFRLFDHGSNQGEIPSLCFDTSGDPHILFADGTGSSYDLKHIKRTSGTWSSPVVVDSITDELGGSGFTTLYSAIAAVSDTVEAWYINGAGDKLRKIRSSGGVWGSLETILAVDTNKLRGQQSVRNADPEFRSVFCELSGYPSLDSSAVLSKRYGYGDSGHIAAAVPMTTVDSLYSSVALLLGFESRDGATRVINEADTCFTATVTGNAQIDTAQFKFGAASLLLDGAGDFVTFDNDPLLQVTNGDFTIECFVRRNGASKLQCIAAKRPEVGTSEYACYVSLANQLIFQVFSSSALILNITGTNTLSAGVWYHVAFTLAGTTGRCFLDGNLEASGTLSGTAASNTGVFKIGRETATNSGRDFNGHIDEFRFTAGTARYTANFTAPSAAFPRR